jgi:hypothetical protein
VLCGVSTLFCISIATHANNAAAIDYGFAGTIESTTSINRGEGFAIYDVDNDYDIDQDSGNWSSGSGVPKREISISSATSSTGPQGYAESKGTVFTKLAGSQKLGWGQFGAFGEATSFASATQTPEPYNAHARTRMYGGQSVALLIPNIGDLSTLTIISSQGSKNASGFQEFYIDQVLKPGNKTYLYALPGGGRSITLSAYFIMQIDAGAGSRANHDEVAKTTSGHARYNVMWTSGAVYPGKNAKKPLVDIISLGLDDVNEVEVQSAIGLSSEEVPIGIDEILIPITNDYGNRETLFVGAAPARGYLVSSPDNPITSFTLPFEFQGIVPDVHLHILSEDTVTFDSIAPLGVENLSISGTAGVIGTYDEQLDLFVMGLTFRNLTATSVYMKAVPEPSTTCLVVFAAFTMSLRIRPRKGPRKGGPRKALSWGNLHFEMSAYILRYYRKVVFLDSSSNDWQMPTRLRQL